MKFRYGDKVRVIYPDSFYYGTIGRVSRNGLIGPNGELDWGYIIVLENPVDPTESPILGIGADEIEKVKGQE